MIILLLEILLILLSPVVHINLNIMHIYGRVRLSIALITIICLVAGLLLPLLASYIDILNLPPGTRCATGSAGFAVIGTFLTLVSILVSAIVFYIIAYYRKRKAGTLAKTIQ